MQTAGIVGGIGPESTVDYYRSIVAAYRERKGDGSYPPLIINSIDLQKVLAFVAAGQLEPLTSYLAGEIEKLAAAGADFAVLASNTPHLVFDPLARRSPIPLISIVEVAVVAARARGLKRPGLFGTRSTMQGSFYAKAFDRAGIAVVSPSAAEQTRIHDIYMNELIPGIFRDESRAAMLEIVSTMQAREKVDSLILGGTELPLLLRGHEVPGVPFLDTARLHVERIVAEILRAD
jgi:aspartate racemase